MLTLNVHHYDAVFAPLSDYGTMFTQPTSGFPHVVCGIKKLRVSNDCRRAARRAACAALLWYSKRTLRQQKEKHYGRRTS